MIKHTGAILAFIIFCGALYSCIVPDSAIEPKQPKFPRDHSGVSGLDAVHAHWEAKNAARRMAILRERAEIEAMAAAVEHNATEEDRGELPPIEWSPFDDGLCVFSEGPYGGGGVTVTRAGVFFALSERLTPFQFQPTSDNLWKSQN